jgi:2-succinyl-6-hydroxy-2,4-cyclohexadiene-1-carboxylate synthase
VTLPAVPERTSDAPGSPRVRSSHSQRLPLRDGLQLHAHEQGQGPCVLLVHGFTGAGSAFGERVLEALSARFRVIAVDLIGHGASDRPHGPQRYAIEAIVRDLCDVLDARAVRHATWVGYSMGARIALAAGVLAPERVAALVCEGGSPGLREPLERSERVRADESLARALEQDGIEPFVERWMSLPLFATQQRLPRATLAHERARRLVNDPRALAACLRGLGTGSQPSFWEALPALRVPALLLAGELDSKYAALASAMAAQLPGADRAIVPAAGHTTHLEQPDAYLAAVLPFIDKVS